MVEEATEYVKTCLRAGPSDALIFCGSGATAAMKRLQEAMGIAVAGDLRERIVLAEEERWVVFVGPWEHHSNLLSWRQTTAEVVEIGVDRRSGMPDMEALEAQLGCMKRTNRRMLGSFSACSNVTGVICDTRGLARLLHQYGAFACFDFATRDTIYNDDIEEREDAGTPPIIQKIRAALAFRVKELVGYDLINLLESFYIESAMERLLPNPAIHLLGNLEPKRLAILSFLIFPSHVNTTTAANSKPLLTGKPFSGRFVAKLLNDLFGIQARGGCSCAGPYGHHLLAVDESFSHGIRSHIQKGYMGMKPGWTRVSFAYYMTKFEFEFILSAIEFIAAYGHRFLSVYAFDWATGDWSYDMKLPMMDCSVGMIKKIAEEKDFLGREKGTKIFAKYLKSARKIAISLPEKPLLPRRVPKNVDRNLIYFRI
ncbi:hypothetical protein KSP39_PZI004523 [Platanthera zijinensis]|uniref:Aminotransferase class V domain-containing protein n=1 Tax=Platanthera zijinensis TaxID=2320716 RepID=A0AAP0GBY9_9ASPA